MRPPPTLNENPQQRYGYLLRGLLMLLFGGVAETMQRPVVPWTYVMGPLILVSGLGVALGLFERYVPNWGSLVYFVLAFGVFYYCMQGDTSVLPLFLYSGFYDLTRFVLRVAEFEL